MKKKYYNRFTDSLQNRIYGTIAENVTYPLLTENFVDDLRNMNTTIRLEIFFALEDLFLIFED